MASCGFSAPACPVATASTAVRKAIRNDFIETSPIVRSSVHRGANAASANAATARQASATEPSLRAGRKPLARRGRVEGGGRAHRCPDSGTNTARWLEAERWSLPAASMQAAMAASTFLRNTPCSRHTEIRAGSRGNHFARGDASPSTFRDRLQRHRQRDDGGVGCSQLSQPGTLLRRTAWWPMPSLALVTQAAKARGMLL